MKLKYAIIATIIFNLVLISIFLCRQYKEYHNRKHDYIRIIEASKAKIIKEIENTNHLNDLYQLWNEFKAYLENQPSLLELGQLFGFNYHLQEKFNQLFKKRNIKIV